MDNQAEKTSTVKQYLGELGRSMEKLERYQNEKNAPKKSPTKKERMQGKNTLIDVRTMKMKLLTTSIR